MSRKGNANEQIKAIENKLCEHLKITSPEFVERVIFGSRIFFIVVNNKHKAILTQRLKGFEKKLEKVRPRGVVTRHAANS
jgi:hypothetical protein